MAGESVQPNWVDSTASRHLRRDKTTLWRQGEIQRYGTKKGLVVRGLGAQIIGGRN